MTGAGSNFPLVRLAAKYNEMTKNGRILSNRHSLDIVRTRIQDLLERIDQNQAPDRLYKLKKLWDRLKEQRTAGQNVEAVLTQQQIDAEFEAAYHDYAAWEQMFQALDLDRKMVESEVKIAKEINAILTAEEAYELTAKLLGAVIGAVSAMQIEEGTKGKLLKRMQYEFSRIVGDNFPDDEPDEETQAGFGGSRAETIDA